MWKIKPAVQICISISCPSSSLVYHYEFGVEVIWNGENRSWQVTGLSRLTWYKLTYTKGTVCMPDVSCEDERSSQSVLSISCLDSSIEHLLTSRNCNKYWDYRYNQTNHYSQDAFFIVRENVRKGQLEAGCAQNVVWNWLGSDMEAWSRTRESQSLLRRDSQVRSPRLGWKEGETWKQ